MVLAAVVYGLSVLVAEVVFGFMKGSFGVVIVWR
jgi:hypothetical protein